MYIWKIQRKYKYIPLKVINSMKGIFTKLGFMKGIHGFNEMRIITKFIKMENEKKNYINNNQHWLKKNKHVFACISCDH